MQRGRFLLVAMILASAACAQDAEERSAQRCKQLRDHLIELRVRAAPAIAQHDAHRAALEQALGNDFVDACRKLPPGDVVCALNASDSAAADQCTSRSQQN